VVGAIDGFRDECVTYALRLIRASVPCDLHVVARLPHAYRAAPGAAAVRHARRDLDDWISRQLAV
jgi:acetyl esterase/lipase